MSKKKTKTKTVSRSGGYNSLLIILVSLVLIAIPLFILGRVVYESYMESGEPIYGDRYKNDFTSEITQDQLTNVESVVSSLANVESVKAYLQSGTLKLQVDLRDDISLEEVHEVENEVYNAIGAVLPIETYFTLTENAKNYDLEINLFNNPETYDIHTIYVKNSSMEAPKSNVVSSPLDSEVTQKIIDEQLTPIEEEPEPTDQEATDQEETETETQP